VCNIARD
jgi:hypothetical protein